MYISPAPGWAHAVKEFQRASIQLHFQEHVASLLVKFAQYWGGRSGLTSDTMSFRVAVVVMLEKGKEASDSRSWPPREGQSLLSGTE